MNDARLFVAAGMDAATVEKLKSGFEAKLGHKISFEVIRDETLIGGFVAYVDSRVYDASIRTQLDNLRRSFDAE